MSPRNQGHVLVAAQFALFAALAWPSSMPSATGPAVGLAGLALFVGVWTLAHNRIGNFNVHPDPHAGGRLVVSGPYRFVRHPMYVAVLLLGAALVAAYASALKGACLGALAIVLWAKTILEERGLRERYPEYDAYAQRVARFVPGVW